VIIILRTLFWRLAEWLHRDRSLGFGADKGDMHHMSLSWIQEKKRDASDTSW